MDGQRGLADAAGAVDQRAPGARLRRDGLRDARQLFLAAEEVGLRRQGGADGRGRRGRGRRRGCRRRAPFQLQPHRLQGVQHELGRVARGGGLARVLVLALVAVRPVADRLDQDPIHVAILARGIQPRALHFAADGLRLELEQLLAERQVVHQLLAGQHQTRSGRSRRPSAGRRCCSDPAGGASSRRVSRVARVALGPLSRCRLVQHQLAGDQDVADLLLVGFTPKAMPTITTAPAPGPQSPSARSVAPRPGRPRPSPTAPSRRGSR